MRQRSRLTCLVWLVASLPTSTSFQVPLQSRHSRRNPDAASSAPPGPLTSLDFQNAPTVNDPAYDNDDDAQSPGTGRHGNPEDDAKSKLQSMVTFLALRLGRSLVKNKTLSRPPSSPTNETSSETESTSDDETFQEEETHRLEHEKEGDRKLVLTDEFSSEAMQDTESFPDEILSNVPVLVDPMEPQRQSIPEAVSREFGKPLEVLERQTTPLKERPKKKPNSKATDTEGSQVVPTVADSESTSSTDTNMSQETPVAAPTLTIFTHETAETTTDHPILLPAVGENQEARNESEPVAVEPATIATDINSETAETANVTSTQSSFLQEVILESRPTSDSDTVEPATIATDVNSETTETANVTSTQSFLQEVILESRPTSDSDTGSVTDSLEEPASSNATNALDMDQITLSETGTDSAKDLAPMSEQGVPTDETPDARVDVSKDGLPECDDTQELEDQKIESMDATIVSEEVASSIYTIEDAPDTGSDFNTTSRITDHPETEAMETASVTQEAKATMNDPTTHVYVEPSLEGAETAVNHSINVTEEETVVAQVDETDTAMCDEGKAPTSTQSPTNNVTTSHVAPLNSSGLELSSAEASESKTNNVTTSHDAPLNSSSFELSSVDASTLTESTIVNVSMKLSNETFTNRELNETAKQTSPSSDSQRSDDTSNTSDDADDNPSADNHGIHGDATTAEDVSEPAQAETGTSQTTKATLASWTDENPSAEKRALDEEAFRSVGSVFLKPTAPQDDLQTTTLPIPATQIELPNRKGLDLVNTNATRTSLPSDAQLNKQRRNESETTVRSDSTFQQQDPQSERTESPSRTLFNSLTRNDTVCDQASRRPQSFTPFGVKPKVTMSNFASGSYLDKIEKTATESEQLNTTRVPFSVSNQSSKSSEEKVDSAQAQVSLPLTGERVINGSDLTPKTQPERHDESTPVSVDSEPLLSAASNKTVAAKASYNPFGVKHKVTKPGMSSYLGGVQAMSNVRKANSTLLSVSEPTAQQPKLKQLEREPVANDMSQSRCEKGTLSDSYKRSEGEESATDQELKNKTAGSSYADSIVGSEKRYPLRNESLTNRPLPLNADSNVRVSSGSGMGAYSADSTRMAIRNSSTLGVSSGNLGSRVNSPRRLKTFNSLSRPRNRLTVSALPGHLLTQSTPGSPSRASGPPLASGSPVASSSPVSFSSISSTQSPASSKIEGTMLRQLRLSKELATTKKELASHWKKAHKHSADIGTLKQELDFLTAKLDKTLRIAAYLELNSVKVELANHKTSTRGQKNDIEELRLQVAQLVSKLGDALDVSETMVTNKLSSLGEYRHMTSRNKFGPKRYWFSNPDKSISQQKVQFSEPVEIQRRESGGEQIVNATFESEKLHFGPKQYWRQSIASQSKNITSSTKSEAGQIATISGSEVTLKMVALNHLSSNTSHDASEVEKALGATSAYRPRQYWSTLSSFQLPQMVNRTTNGEEKLNLISQSKRKALNGTMTNEESGLSTGKTNASAVIGLGSHQRTLSSETKNTKNLQEDKLEIISLRSTEVASSATLESVTNDGSTTRNVNGFKDGAAIRDASNPSDGATTLDGKTSKIAYFSAMSGYSSMTKKSVSGARIPVASDSCASSFSDHDLPEEQSPETSFDNEKAATASSTSAKKSHINAYGMTEAMAQSDSKINSNDLPCTNYMPPLPQDGAIDHEERTLPISSLDDGSQEESFFEPVTQPLIEEESQLTALHEGDVSRPRVEVVEALLSSPHNASLTNRSFSVIDDSFNETILQSATMDSIQTSNITTFSLQSQDMPDLIDALNAESSKKPQGNKLQSISDEQETSVEEKSDEVMSDLHDSRSSLVSFLLNTSTAAPKCSGKMERMESMVSEALIKDTQGNLKSSSYVTAGDESLFDVDFLFEDSQSMPGKVTARDITDNAGSSNRMRTSKKSKDGQKTSRLRGNKLVTTISNWLPYMKPTSSEREPITSKNHATVTMNGEYEPLVEDDYEAEDETVYRAHWLPFGENLPTWIYEERTSYVKPKHLRP